MLHMIMLRMMNYYWIPIAIKWPSLAIDYSCNTSPLQSSVIVSQYVKQWTGANCRPFVPRLLAAAMLFASSSTWRSGVDSQPVFPIFISFLFFSFLSFFLHNPNSMAICCLFYLAFYFLNIFFSVYREVVILNYFRIAGIVVRFSRGVLAPFQLAGRFTLRGKNQ